MINNADIVLHFNPRSPCGERREMDGLPIYVTTFQSTLPVWGATRAGLLKNLGYDISIHAPRVGSDKGFGFFDAEVGISIHAPRVGSDLFIRDQLRVGSDDCAALDADNAAISIHAPRVGSDTEDNLFVQEPEISIHAPRVGSDAL